MDPVADMLTIIRNGLAVKKATVEFPFSKLKFEIVKILEKEDFIEKAEKKGRGKKMIEITLKYLPDGEPAISGLKKISKPGQRIYLKSKEIRKVKGGYGFSIISTSKGLLTNKEARKQNSGGEVVCEIW